MAATPCAGVARRAGRLGVAAHARAADGDGRRRADSFWRRLLPPAEATPAEAQRAGAAEAGQRGLRRRRQWGRLRRARRRAAATTERKGSRPLVVGCTRDEQASCCCSLLHLACAPPLTAWLFPSSPRHRTCAAACGALHRRHHRHREGCAGRCPRRREGCRRRWQADGRPQQRHRCLSRVGAAARVSIPCKLGGWRGGGHAASCGRVFGGGAPLVAARRRGYADGGRAHPDAAAAGTTRWAAWRARVVARVG